MRMCDHPNVLSCYASFVHENELWLVMEFMSKGSCLHVMNVAKKEVSHDHLCCFKSRALSRSRAMFGSSRMNFACVTTMVL